MAAGGAPGGEPGAPSVGAGRLDKGGPREQSANAVVGRKAMRLLDRLRVGLGPICRRSRRDAIVLFLSLAVSVFGLESAVHSVHHLTSPESAGTCPVLAGSEHLGWGEIPVVAGDPPLPRVAAAPALASEPIGHSPIDRPRHERAPPA